MKQTEVAYMAGLVDGEAYIGIKKSTTRKECQNPGYQARIQIRMVDEPAIKFISKRLGGWYYKEKPSVAKGRPLYCYQASDKKAEGILQLLLPFLRVKKKAASIVLRLRRLQSNGGKHRTKITGYRDFHHHCGKVFRIPNRSFSDAYVKQCEQLYLSCKVLNRVGV